MLNLITYEDKEALNINSSVADKNKVNASDMNMIKETINNLTDIFYPVGSYYYTSDANFNPNNSFGGTWVLDNDGTILVSKSNSNNSKFNADLGIIVGEETHKLTINEMPAHQHALTIIGGGSQKASGVQWATQNTTRQYAGDMIQSVGGGNAHNNVQPSKIANRWHRTA